MSESERVTSELFPIPPQVKEAFLLRDEPELRPLAERAREMILHAKLARPDDVMSIYGDQVRAEGRGLGLSTKTSDKVLHAELILKQARNEAWRRLIEMMGEEIGGSLEIDILGALRQALRRARGTLDGNNALGHIGTSMDDATARLKAVAADFGLPVNIARQVLMGAASEFMARETTTRTTKPSRPETAAPATTAQQAPAPRAPQWPTEKWKGSPENAIHKHHAILSFMRRVWTPFIAETGAVVTRDILATQDDGAALALKRYVENNGALPTDILILFPKDLRELSRERPVIVRIDPPKTRG